MIKPNKVQEGGGLSAQQKVSKWRKHSCNANTWIDKEVKLFVNRISMLFGFFLLLAGIGSRLDGAGEAISV